MPSLSSIGQQKVLILDMGKESGVGENVFGVLDCLIGSYKLADSCSFVFDLFVQCCAKLRMVDKGLDVCKLLDENGFRLSVISYNTLLHVVQKSEKTSMVWGIYEYMIEKRIYPNEMTTRIMISALCKEGRLQRFLDVVEKSHGKRCQPGVVVNTCLIYGMIEEGRIEDGLRLMRRMLQKNMILDTISCSLIVLAKVKMRDLESAWGVYDEMHRRGFEGNALVYDSFIGAYCEEKRIDEAIKLMDEMECLNMKPFGETFNHLIKVCSEMGRLEESLKFCDKMIGNGLLPSCLSFNKLVAKLCENGSAKFADKLLTTLMDKGFIPDQSIYSYLIAGYANVGDVEGALKLYYEMQYSYISKRIKVVSHNFLCDGIGECLWQVHWMDESDGTSDSVLKHKPIWATYNPKWKKEKKRTVEKKKQGDLHRTCSTKVIPVFVLSLADMDEHLMMEYESLVWTSKDVVIVLQHQNDKMPLRGTQYMHMLRPFTGSARHRSTVHNLSSGSP
ncbi:hypothetical protein KY290_025495 [Solanum tuberosum]|uniref:Pentatricopeptide repeat-containing protein n=1 Tax=Solanum tuberosum TaxID=4113 RepID=A0ABQ7UTQ1_SOLTU|nr:hypothetical protein KY290_025495 [Solanum tuberosum]